MKNNRIESDQIRQDREISADPLRTDQSVAIARRTATADHEGPPMTTTQNDHPNETAARGLVSPPVASSAGVGLSRAVIYLRVSTNEQAETDYGDEGFSIPAQREACRRKAQQLGAAVVDEYLDRGESARSAARPQLQAMLQRLRLARDVDFVIVHKIDRLARSREDDVSIVMDIRDAGAKITSATENIDETPSGKLLHGIMATIAEFYSSNLSAEARKGMEQKAKVGGTTHKAPIGYRNAPTLVDGREIRSVVIDEERAAHVRWAFGSFAGGEFTISTLTDALAERGLVSFGDRRFAPKPLVRSKVHKMLRNPYYVGIVTFNGVQYAGRHEPLVTLDVFNDVQQTLDDRSNTGEKPVKRTHYLKGMLACGHCKRRLGLTWSTSKDGTKYPYFFCLGRRAHKSNGCTLPYLPLEQVEAEVERYWSQVRVQKDILDGIRTSVTDLIHLAADQYQAELANQRLRLQRLDTEEQKLLQAHYADAISLPLLQKEQQRIKVERSKASGLVASLTLETDAMQRSLDAALERVDRCDEVYRSGSDQIRRDLCFAMFHRIYVSEDGVVGAELATPFAELLDPELPARIEAERVMIEEGRFNDLMSSAWESETPEADARSCELVGASMSRSVGNEIKEHPGGQSGCSNLSLLVGEEGLEPSRS